MHVKEKYDHIISTIENLVQDPTLSAREISLEAAKVTGVQSRDLSAIFSFLVDTTLNSYISSRKMDLAYSLLTQDKKLDIQSAVEISGYSDQPSFTKAFRRRYSMTPKEAHLKRDMTLLGKPIFWDMLFRASTCENCAYCAIYSVLEVGSMGSWYFICATRSWRKASLSIPVDVVLRADERDSCEALVTISPFLTDADTDAIYTPILSRVRHYAI